jgi:hypothetical protein
MRKLLAVVLVLTFAGVCMAEPMRPLMTKENKFPGQARLEAGFLWTHIDYAEREASVELVEDELVITEATDREEMAVTPYVRAGLLDNVAVFGALPIRSIDEERGDDENGIGDVMIGMELKVYEDIFDYPYVIPHIEVQFDTGDEDEGLGRGETVVSFGCSVGTVVEDVYHFIIDGQYQVLDESDNIAKGAISFIWDVSDEFSVLAEASISDEEVPGGAEHPGFFQGGLCYKPIEEWSINVYGGGGKNADEDVVITMKTAYTF